MGRFGCPKPFFLFEKPTALDLVVIFVAEILGTAILLFIGCLGCISIHTALSAAHMSWSFGLAVLMAVQCFAHVSGSHINPVVTLAAVLLGHLSWTYLPIYFVGQFIGAIVGYGLLKVVTPPRFIKPEGASNGICSPGFNSNITAIQAFLVEFGITLVLVLVCCAVWDKRNSNNIDSTPVRFGLTVGGLAFSGISYTGAHMNPARTFGPAILNGDFHGGDWIYYTAPLLSAVVGALAYRFLFTPLLDKQQKKDDAE